MSARGSYMTLENIYYIGQTIAVLAILVSLVAIYFQQRQRVRQANAEAVRDVFEKYQSYLGSLSTDPEYARLVRVSTLYWEKLSDNQKFLTHLFWWKLGSIAENLFQQHANNIGAYELYEGVESSITGMLCMPGVRAWWESAKFSYSAEFREAVDKRLADESNLPPSWAEFPLWLASDEDLQIVLSSEEGQVDAEPEPDNEDEPS